MTLADSLMAAGGSDAAALGSIPRFGRGSYAKYGPKFDHGLLFGKYEGMFWRPAKMASGEQERTYEVK